MKHVYKAALKKTKKHSNKEDKGRREENKQSSASLNRQSGEGRCSRRAPETFDEQNRKQETAKKLETTATSCGASYASPQGRIASSHKREPAVAPIVVETAILSRTVFVVSKKRQLSPQR